MTEVENTEKNELMGVVHEFADIATTKEFEDNYKHDEKFRKQIMNLTGIFNQFSKNLGVTEYTTSDRGYTGDQVLEKHKQGIAKSWKGKKAKRNAVKQITHDEIMNATNSYLERRNNLLKKREAQRIESGEAPRKLEGMVGKDSKKLHMSGKHITKIENIPIYKYDENQEEESSSSDEDEDDITNNIFGIKSHSQRRTPISLPTNSDLRIGADTQQKDLDNIDNYFNSVLDGSDSE